MSEWTREEQKKHSAEWTRQYEKGQQDAERRIINSIEEQIRQCEKAGLWANGIELREQLQELHLGLNAALEIIKGENR